MNDDIIFRLNRYECKTILKGLRELHKVALFTEESFEDIDRLIKTFTLN